MEDLNDHNLCEELDKRFKNRICIPTQHGSTKLSNSTAKTKLRTTL